MILLLPSAGKAQSTPKLEQLRAMYPEKVAVITQNSEDLMIDVKDTGLAITSTTNFEIVYLNDRTKEYANKDIYYSDFSEVKNIEAHTVTSDKNGNKTITVKDIYSKDDFGRGIFYGSGKKLEFVFPGVSDGAHSYLTYKERIKDPHFLTPFYFGSYSPVMNAEFSVTFPKEVKIKARLYGGDTSKIKFTIKQSHKYTTYTWTATNIPEEEFEEDAPPFSSYATHVILCIDEYTYKGKTVKVLENIDDLYSWYHTLTAKVNDKVDDALYAIVDSLCKDVKDDREKARRIFYWVQDKIKYVAFEAGLEGFVPRNAASL